MRIKLKCIIVGIFILMCTLSGCNTQDFSSDPVHASGKELDSSEEGKENQAVQNQQAEQKQQVSQEEKTQNNDGDESGVGEAEQGSLTVHYLDVGQGNAVLAESDGCYMLIDGGARESSSFVVSYLKEQNIEKLDYVLISHFDEDHLAGAIGALYNFPVDMLITPDYETDSSIYNSYKEAVKEKGYEPVHPKPGQEFALGSSSFRIFSPVTYGHQDENQDSVGIILENSSRRIFIGGDIGLQGEKEILQEGADIRSDVMLMNHHGSHVSREFLEAVSPDYAVISCGADNSYGHPREDTMELLDEEQIPVFRTDIQGTITASVSEGEILFLQEPCNDYTPGDRGNSGEYAEDSQEESMEALNNSTEAECDYVLNVHTKKIHRPDCGSVKKMEEKNRAYYKGDQEELKRTGYTGCGNCKP